MNNPEGIRVFFLGYWIWSECLKIRGREPVSRMGGFSGEKDCEEDEGCPRFFSGCVEV
ncbi:hypothetical protein COLO4_00047 [Corchorus olitorius]|uniref:Uncharacterized protein n=1 Tax=Corchorus olitorius TaxID=93759 RepID=A0A1R3L4W7_9ROSI|nr:hypothetical protein COLO4_00047 [Corchorus olitorius]